MGLLLICGRAQAQNNTPKKGEEAYSSTVQKGTQEKKNFQYEVDEVVGQGIIKRQVSGLDALQRRIEGDSRMNAHQKRYWKTYLQYYKTAIYQRLKDNKHAARAIDRGISLLADQARSSEDYALLASCKMLSLSYANMTSVASISREVRTLAKKALELNPNNLRAYYVLAAHNLYTPKMFGGMTKVEAYAVKGLHCPTSLNPEDYYTPRWGKRVLYKVLIQFYKREKKEGQRLKYQKLAKEAFPNEF